MRTAWLAAVFLWCVASAGCSASTASIASVNAALIDASALGATAQLAFNAITTTSASACATVTTACATFPCTGAATVALGTTCPLPFGDVTSGSVQLTGSFSSATMATFSSTFVGVSLGTAPIDVVSATNLTVSQGTTELAVVYDEQDVHTSLGASVLQSSWNVSFGTNGTVIIAGSRQEADIGAEQITITNATLDPSCRLNPISGTATIQVTSLGSIVDDSITFHAACDGRADVQSATGGTTSVAL